MNNKLTYIYIFLIFTFGFGIFYKTWSIPLKDYDEAIYAQVARQSLEERRNLGIEYFGNLGMQKPWLGPDGMKRTGYWFEKPPLMIWLTELSFYTFGINEFSARLWVGIFSLAIFILVFFTGKLLFDSSLAGILGSSVMFVCSQFITSSNILQFDIPVSFFILLSFYSFWKSKKNVKWLWVFWISLGFGVLTKSVIGLLPLPLIAVYSLLYKDVFYFKLKEFYWGFFVFLLLIVPWHLAESLIYGKMFWNQYLFYHVLERFSRGLENNIGPFWYYLDLIFKQRILLSLAILSIVVFVCKKHIKQPNYGHVFVSALFILAFFSISNTKLPAYILVLYPFLSLFIAGELTYLMRSVRYNTLILISMALFFCVLGLKYKMVYLKMDFGYQKDSKEIGLYLNKNYQNKNIYYYSETGTKPAVIFYANRIVYFLSYPSPKPEKEFLLISEIKPDFAKTELLLSQNSQSLYLVKD